MYHLNSSLPAPYELNNSMPQIQSFARGGRAKHKKVIAHFSPQELHVMDHLQGHQERCPKTGLRSYSHLEEILKNPHILGTVHKHTHEHRQRHARGGEIEHLRRGGRNGDTELALIGPHTHHLLHQLAGGSTTNPHTGHPEFWSLGSVLGGLGSALKGAASTVGKGISSAAKAAAPFAQKAFSTIGQGAKALGTHALSAAKAAAPHIGTALTTIAPLAAQFGQQYLANKLQGNPQDEDQGFNPENYINMLPESMQGLAQAGLGAYNSFRGGASPEQAFGQGLSQFGQQVGGNVGNAMQGFGGALGQGKDIRSALGSGASRFGQGYGGAFGQGLQSAGNAFSRGEDFGQSLGQGFNKGLEALGGGRGLANSASNVFRGYGTPGGMYGAAQREGRGYMQKALPNYYSEENPQYYTQESPPFNEEDQYMNAYV
jgi:hypothetical protein